MFRLLKICIASGSILHHKEHYVLLIALDSVDVFYQSYYRQPFALSRGSTSGILCEALRTPT